VNIHPARQESTVKRTRLMLAAVALAVLTSATGCWRNHCCESSYKPSCCPSSAPAPAPAYYGPAGCP